MKNLRISFDPNKGRLDFSYTITSKRLDYQFINELVDKVIEKRLLCSFGEDDFSMRFGYISSSNPDIYQEICEIISKYEE